jgi:hypothetical protein
MALFRSLPHGEIDRFAAELAEELAREFPPAPAAGTSRSASDGAFMRVLESVCERAAAYRRAHRLRLAQQTRLGQAFRERLEALGYSDRFVDTATEALMVYVARRP